jgi:hypothetical protein
MRGIFYLLAIAGITAAQGNQTVSAATLSPTTTEEAVFSVAGGGGYNTCKAATTVTKWNDKPYTLVVTSYKTTTSTCYETKTSTKLSTTTCTVVSCPLLICIDRESAIRTNRCHVDTQWQDT